MNNNTISGAQQVPLCVSPLWQESEQGDGGQTCEDEAQGNNTVSGYNNTISVTRWRAEETQYSASTVANPSEITTQEGSMN